MLADAAAPPRADLSRAILVGALALALLADALLRATPWGLNAALWLALLAGVVAALAWWRHDAFAGLSPWLALPLLLTAAGLAWRDSLVLKGLDLLALVVVFGLASLRVPGMRLRTAGLALYALGVGAAALNAWVEAVTLLGEQRLHLNLHSGPLRVLPAALRGLLLAAPLLLIFGGLLVAADAVFEQFVRRTTHVDLSDLPGHLVVVGIAGWVIGGSLRGAATGGIVQPGEARPAPPRRLGGVEMAVVLGLLDALFLAFVLVQFRYFFGGAARVEASTSLTYADYARRGFFELCAVAALSLPLLLLVHWLLHPERAGDQRAFRLLAALQIVLLFVIMASAVQRMRLYQREYGLTELRLYTTAFMAWLAAVFLWFGATVLRGRRERFAFGLLVSGLVAIALLHALNPDALIARTNAARAAEGRRFDAGYVAGLSADAVPSLVAALPQLSRIDRCRVAAELRPRWSGDDGWRTWSWSRSRAQRAVTHDLPALAADC